MKRGGLYWVNLEPVRSPELGKTRPGLIISNTEHNLRLPTVTIVPISSQPPAMWPLRVAFTMPDGKASFVIIPGIRQVHKSRLHSMIGSVTSSVLTEMEDALFAYLKD